jgi:predicted RNase H-like HicB family nuclease
MTYGILLERIADPAFSREHYYAHIPSLGLTTHGLGVDGAREAARDLIRLWIEEKRSAGESISPPTDFLLSTIDVPEDALQSA